MLPDFNRLNAHFSASCRIISKLEDFCASGEFTQFLSDFAQEHAGKFVGEGEEQPIECYTLFQ